MKSLEEIAEIHGPKFMAKNKIFSFDDSRMHEMWSALTTGVNLRDAGTHFYAIEVEWTFSKDRAEWEYIGPFCTKAVPPKALGLTADADVAIKQVWKTRINENGEKYETQD